MEHQSFGHQLVRSVALALLTLVIVVGLAAGAFVLISQRGPDIEDRSWLVVDLYGPVSEYDPPGGLVDRVMGGDVLTLQSLLDGFGKAARDDRIRGVLLKVSASNGAGWGKLQEMRAAIAEVRAAGKPVYAWGDTYTLPVFYLAATCDSVFAPPSAYLRIKGLQAESQHVRKTLDKLGIEPHLHKIKDYKAAAEMVMETEMTPQAREMRDWMLHGVWDDVVPTLARERGLTQEAIEQMMEQVEFSADDAVAAGLIDEVVYWQDLQARLEGDDDPMLRTVDLARYEGVKWKDVGLKGKATICVVHAQGMIGGRENRVDPLLGIMMGHESVVRELRRARLDEDVKAVVFRVDSRGGESLASDLISHEVDLLADVKPVVVSMVDVAASGGYDISYRATRLMAAPLTVTGSIGSISGFFDMRGLYDKLGITKDFVTLGPMARFGGDYHKPTDEEWERFTEAHWESFNRWLRDVAERRDLTFEEAQSLAWGRVWTGSMAAANGLIDAVGTFQDAVKLAAELAGIESDTPLKVVHLPEKPSLLDTVFGGDKKPDAPVAAAVRWHLYRTLQQEARLSLQALQAEAVATPAALDGR